MWTRVQFQNVTKIFVLRLRIGSEVNFKNLQNNAQYFQNEDVHFKTCEVRVESILKFSKWWIRFCYLQRDQFVILILNSSNKVFNFEICKMRLSFKVSEINWLFLNVTKKRDQLRNLQNEIHFFFFAKWGHCF